LVTFKVNLTKFPQMLMLHSGERGVTVNDELGRMWKWLWSILRY